MKKQRYKAVWQIDQDSPWVSYPRAIDDAEAIKIVKRGFDGSAHITFVSIHNALDECILAEGRFRPFWNDDMPVILESDGFQKEQA